MYSVVRLLDVAESERERVLSAVRASAAATGAQHSLVQPTLPGVRNGGDVLARLRFHNEVQWLSVADDFATALRDTAIARVNGAEYTGTSTPGTADGTVYRALLLRVAPDADVDAIAQFEADLRCMPRYVPAIAAWQLSRIDHSIGDTPWTHVFEQEFTDVDGLLGPYLMHPVHWAVVDRWFDPECPEVIVRDGVCHSFCKL